MKDEIVGKYLGVGAIGFMIGLVFMFVIAVPMITNDNLDTSEIPLGSNMASSVSEGHVVTKNCNMFYYHNPNTEIRILDSVDCKKTPSLQEWNVLLKYNERLDGVIEGDFIDYVEHQNIQHSQTDNRKDTMIMVDAFNTTAINSDGKVVYYEKVCPESVVNLWNEFDDSANEDAWQRYLLSLCEWKPLSQQKDMNGDANE